MNTTTLSNGVTIHPNRNETGYQFASYNTNQRQFLSYVHKVDVVAVAPEAADFQPGSSPTFTLGWFDDAREAAYAAEFFMKNITKIISEYNQLNPNRKQVFSMLDIDFPSDLYQLPVPNVKVSAIKTKQARKALVRAVTKAVTKTDNRIGRDIICQLFDFKSVIASLGAKFGRTLVAREMDVLTVNEFELRYGITK